MAEEKRVRRSKKDVLISKIQKNAEKVSALQEKIDSLNAETEQMKSDLADIEDAEKKAAEAAKKEELFKAIKASGMTIDQVREKLGL